MKKFWITAVTLTLLVIGFFVLSKPADSPELKTQPATKLSFSAIENEVKNGSATLLDVRTAEEFSAGHFKNAVNLSLQDLQAGKLPSSAKTQPLYIYCRSGNRSAQATSLLKNAGYNAITDLGGLDDVTAIGGTLIQ